MTIDIEELKKMTTPLPWRITDPGERKGREIVGANGATVAKLTALDMDNADLIVSAVNALSALQSELAAVRQELSIALDASARQNIAAAKVWQERDALRQELEEAKRDAERYRWLRGRATAGIMTKPYWAFPFIFNHNIFWGKDQLDSDVDAARTQSSTKHCQCRACKDGAIHASDCAVHNVPAMPNGECNCGAARTQPSKETIVFDNPSYPAWLAENGKQSS